LLIKPLNQSVLSNGANGGTQGNGTVLEWGQWWNPR
jgi:hypothetical protein